MSKNINSTHQSHMAVPLDGLVNDKIGLDRFISFLTDVERDILNHKLDGWPETRIECKLNISHRQFKKIKEGILSKIKLAFTG